MKVNMNVGAAGEFSIRVLRPDGSVKIDLPAQPNLITDNGLALLANNPHQFQGGQNDNATGILSNCAVGTGSTQPTYADVALTNIIAVDTEQEYIGGTIQQPTAERPYHVRVSGTEKFTFNGIKNQNITEIGLCSVYNNDINNISLYTHALIKDSSGSPTSVTVLDGEVLEVIYTIHQYYDIRQKRGEVTLTYTDAKDVATGETETYEYMIQPYAVTDANPTRSLSLGYYSNFQAYGVKETDEELAQGYPFENWTQTADKSMSDNDMLQLIGANTDSNSPAGSYSYKPYAEWIYQNDYYLLREIEKAGFKQRYRINIPFTRFNFDKGIRVIIVDVYTAAATRRMNLLAVFANKANGKGIPKTADDRFAFDVIITASRYDGVE